jgi:hypothetical protein
MARGTTLGELVSQLRLESRLDPSPALSLNMVPLMEQTLRRTQERLYDEFDWPFLKITRDVTMEAGSRYYDVPTDMNLERIHSIDYLWSGQWIPVHRGISVEQYNALDSDNDIRSDPIQRWDVGDTGDGQQVEVWPVPAANGNALRFTGIRKLKPLISQAQIADLDDQMIVLYAAAEMLGGAKNDLGALKLNMASARKKTLQGRVTKTRTNRFSLNGNNEDPNEGSRVPLVQYARAV